MSKQQALCSYLPTIAYADFQCATYHAFMLQHKVC